jgi:CheY-like chemotaxis protein
LGTAGAAERPAGKAVEILVVDDSAVERRRAGSALEKCSGPGQTPDGDVHVLYAGNGREALTVIQQRRPKLVVTDLVMPQLDGLGLVKEIRTAYPSIPVVLMTAHGSEEIAAAALRAGAASYVPKKYLARDLGETVATILRLARADGEQLIFPHLTASEYRFTLPNELALVSPLVDFLQGHLARTGVCPEVDELRVGIALSEALVNAITHGNLELSSDLRETNYEGYLRCLAERRNQSPYRDRRVRVTARETPREVAYTVRDEGPGFNPADLPDPTDPENFKKATGRGLYLIHTFMDEVTFNDAGNEITLVKRRAGESAPVSPPRPPAGAD